MLMSASFPNEQVGFAVGWYGTILKSTDGGETWESQESDTWYHLFGVHFVTTLSGWAVGELGTILTTVNGGAEWRTQRSGTSEWLYSVDFLDESVGWVAGSEGAILKTIDGGGSTSSFVPLIASSAIPDGFSLSQNYPNPFNPVTTIRFQLPKRCELVLKIYDTLGREVDTLIEGIRDAGEHEISWDASGLPSGVYIYRLSTRDVVITKKLIKTQ